MPVWAVARFAVRAALRTPWLRRLLLITLGLALLIVPAVGVTIIVSVFGDAGAAAAAAPEHLPGIPDPALKAYTTAVSQAGQYSPPCKGLTWADLAAIAQVESSQGAGHTIGDDGTVTPPIYGIRLDGSSPGTQIVYDTDQGTLDGDPVYDRAVGPFQLLPATWREVWSGLGKGGSGNPQNFYDAALVAAVYLCGDGNDLSQRAGLSAAIFRYNHSQQYVDQVLAWVDTYTALGSQAPGQGGGSQAGERIIAAAQAELGVSYSWGGGGTAGPGYGTCDGGASGCHTQGFDCSGLTQYAYAQAGLAIPRVAQDQYDQAPVKLPASAGLSDLQPGDLLFFAYDTSNPDAYYGNVHHVGIYAGGGMMIDSPHTDSQVREEAVWLDQFAGAARY